MLNRLLTLLLLALIGPIYAAETTFTVEDGEIRTVSGSRLISGVYPHLTTYAHGRASGVYKDGAECGIGAVVPWAGKLWMINYAAHLPNGSDHKLYSIDESLTMTLHPESVGGTPAARLIHRESKQLLIGAYLIDESGKVRVIPPSIMPGRITAIARHLKDPENMVYYYMMEGDLWEGNVHTLEVKKLFNDPLPGWHGKGGYTSQGLLVLANNGESGGMDKGTGWQVQDVGDPRGDHKTGSLAQWDGTTWTLLERHQFTDVTGPGGIYGAPDDKSQLWTMGWDRRSVRLKLLQDRTWSTYLLPKATHNNDAAHGWYTEWPRIREIGGGRAMMDMHGMFFNFPMSFSRENSAGISPISSHLRYLPDFCNWNGRLVLASDETSIQGNRLAGQPQSNLWFGKVEELAGWGPQSGYGGPWVHDAVTANTPSDPYLINGFDRRVLFLINGAGKKAANSPSTGIQRSTGKYTYTALPDLLQKATVATVPRGDMREPGIGFQITLDRPATIYLAVDARAVPELPGWKRTELTASWENYQDLIFSRDCPAGPLAIPGNGAHVTDVNYGVPHAAFIVGEAKVTAGTAVSIRPGNSKEIVVGPTPAAAGDCTVTLEVDRAGNGQWQEYRRVAVPRGSMQTVYFEDDFKAQWIRLKTDRDVDSITAYFHYTDNDYPVAAAAGNLFNGLAEIGYTGPVDAPLGRVSGTSYDLNMLAYQVVDGKAGEGTFVNLSNTFAFVPGTADEKLQATLLAPSVKWSVDAASVVVVANGVTCRLPKGPSGFDHLGDAAFVRSEREVESERNLLNIHGTFYEGPRGNDMIDEMRPVASHNRQIFDYYTWNGLLLLAGVRRDATPGEHILKAADASTSVWAGGIDDLWKLGKPVGTGGPWKDTPVKAGVPSDRYLMTGYDRKSVELTADTEMTITIEADVDHQSGWNAVHTVAVKAGETVRYAFPKAFSAHWVRVRSDRSGIATAWFVYE